MGRVRIFTVAATLAALAAAAGANGTSGAAGLARLKEGNARAVEQRATATAAPAPSRNPGEPAPYAAVLSCADARVPPEAVFQAATGDLFVVRSLGHVTDRAMLASLEYAADALGVPLLVVMGHESCDVVKAATEPAAPAPAGFDYVVKAIRPSAARVAAEPAATRVRAAILLHVEETINQLLQASPVLRRRAESGHLTIAGAYYEMGTGRVHFSEPVRVPPRITAAPAAGAALTAGKTASGARPAQGAAAR